MESYIQLLFICLSSNTKFWKYQILIKIICILSFSTNFHVLWNRPDWLLSRKFNLEKTYSFKSNLLNLIINFAWKSNLNMLTDIVPKIKAITSVIFRTKSPLLLQSLSLPSQLFTHSLTYFLTWPSIYSSVALLVSWMRWKIAWRLRFKSKPYETNIKGYLWNNSS